MKQKRPDNAEISDVLTRIADLLEAQAANPFRIRAYRRASQSVRSHADSIAKLALSEDSEDLEAIPAIGTSIAASIRELVHTGSLGLLERISGNTSPEDLFSSIAGVGQKLAHRIHADLDIETLEEMELAAHDGRLRCVKGIGKGRLHMIQDALNSILSKAGQRRARRLINSNKGRITQHNEPSVEMLLQVDMEYRTKAEAGSLKRIAPRRFNPEKISWLPILHTEHDPWEFTVLYSNSLRAHEQKRTRDWVIIHYERDDMEDRCTIVTEYQGPLTGKRVIRGRERECGEWYSQ